jgi:hypothetical protein
MGVVWSCYEDAIEREFMATGENLAEIGKSTRLKRTRERSIDRACVDIAHCDHIRASIE